MAQRRRSVPAAQVAPESSSSSSPLPAPTPSSSLLAKAETLAKMTYELNLRAVSGKAERLERDIRDLTIRTEADREFRSQFEVRLSKAMEEIYEIKCHMAKLEENEGELKATVEEQQKLMVEVMDGYRKEVAELRTILDGFDSQLAKLPTIDDVRNDVQAQFSALSLDAKPPSLEEAKRARCNRLLARKARIDEFLRSTRGWNTDHKTTPLPDDRFIAQYFKKQYKRDRNLAEMIQNAVQRRLRPPSHGKLPPRPPSFNDAFRDMTWQGVREAIQVVLVDNQKQTIRAMKG